MNAFLNLAACTNDIFSNVDDFNKFNFSRDIAFEVSLIMESFKSRAGGYEGIQVRLVRALHDFIVVPMTHINNSCFITSVFSDLWKYTWISPILKRTFPMFLNISNYLN